MTDILKSLTHHIHVYNFDLSCHTSKINDTLYCLLDENEQTKAKQYKFDFLRERYIQAHIKLRQILMLYTYMNPIILKKPDGKPYLRDFPIIEFNLSHSENWAICAVTLDKPVGVDIEYENKDSNIDFINIAENFFSLKEVERIKSTDNLNQLFLTMWTRKEAYIKSIGLGLSNELLSKDIPEHIDIFDYKFNKNYIAALAIQKCDKNIVLINY